MITFKTFEIQQAIKYKMIIQHFNTETTQMPAWAYRNRAFSLCLEYSMGLISL